MSVHILISKDIFRKGCPLKSWKLSYIPILYGPRREKTCLQGFVYNTGADHPAHLRSLISAFVIPFLESIIF